MAGNTMKYLRVDPALRAELRARVEPARSLWPVALSSGRWSPRPSRLRCVPTARAHGRAARGLMLAYIVRRVLYAIPILIGVNLITFALFFVVNTPDDMARMHLGAKRVTPEAIEKWKAGARLRQAAAVEREGRGFGKLTDTIFFEKSVRCSRSTSAAPRTSATSRTRSAPAWGRASRSRSRCSWSGSR